MLRGRISTAACDLRLLTLNCAPVEPTVFTGAVPYAVCCGKARRYSRI